MKKFSRIIAMVLLVVVMGISFAGCGGSYAAFNKVHPFFDNLGGKYIGGIVNWIIGFAIAGICMTGDVLIFNVIEFWTGKNIIGSANTLEQIDENGNQYIATKNEDGTLSLKVIEISGKTSEYLLARNVNDFNMYDANGVLISSYTAEYEELIN